MDHAGEASRSGEDHEGREIQIPPQIVTPDGQEIPLTGSVWSAKVRAESVASISIWVGLCDDEILAGRAGQQIRLYLAGRLRSVKPSTVYNDSKTFSRFLRWWKKHSSERLRWDRVSASDWRAFLKHGLTQKTAGNDFALLRRFYEWGAFDRQFVEFDEDVAREIRTYRARGNRKGQAVRNLDPEKGPYDDTEIKLIRDALADELGTLEQRITVQLFLELGVRPIVLPILRGKHFRCEELQVVNPGGDTGIKSYYQIRVPTVKRRAARISAWTWRPVSDRLGDEIESVRSTDEDLLLPWLSEVSWDTTNSWIKHFRDDTHYLRIADDLKDWASEANLFSPRTGRPLHLTPRRFRYTLATNAAIEGASRAEIATLLDHSDLQNVDVYVDASSVVLNRMQEDGAFDFFDDVVDLFRGEIADTDTTDLPSEHIPGSAPHLDGLSNVTGTVGACRKDSPCSLAPPLSCYTCPLFTAFRDAPHDRVASALREEIQSVKKSVDRRIPQQLIATYQAVEQLRKRLDEGR